jgi:hypothetical protein
MIVAFVGQLRKLQRRFYRRSLNCAAQPQEGRLETGQVAVGTTVAHRPPHRSVQALLTHTAPISDG